MSGPSMRLIGWPSSLNCSRVLSVTWSGGVRLAGGGRERAVANRASGRSMHHLTVLRVARRLQHLPALGRRRDEHRPRGGARLAQHLIRARSAVAPARVEGDLGETWIRDRLLEPDAAPVRVQLLRHHHREQRAHALTHLVPDDRDRDPIVGRDAEEEIGREVGGRIRDGAGRARPFGQIGGEHEARHGDRGALDEFAPGERHRWPSNTAPARLIAARMRL
jgi:hypothetical protein